MTWSHIFYICPDMPNNQSLMIAYKQYLSGLTETKQSVKAGSIWIVGCGNDAVLIDIWAGLVSYSL